MLSTRTNYIFGAIFTLCMGFFCIYGGISIFFNIEDSIERGLILANYSNPLIKYSPSIAFLLAGAACFTLPFVVVKYRLPISENYHKGSWYQKARTDLALIILFAPSLLFFVLSAYYSNLKINNYPLFIGIVFILCFFPLKAIYGVIKFKNKET